MEIGNTAEVAYMGKQGDDHLFTTSLFSELVRVPDSKLFGQSVLNSPTKYVLKRNTVSQYTVSVAS